MTIRKLTRRNALDLVIGAKILANGGGGSDSKAIENINKIYDQEQFFRIGDLSDFGQDDFICIIGEVGGGITVTDRKLVENLSIILKNPMIEAVRQLETFLEVDFRAFVATELGPNNSVVPLMVASQMENKITIDGDCCGRSKPKISISTTTVENIPISPYAIVSDYADILIVKSVIDDSRGEILARTIARISKGKIAVARCPMTMSQAKKAIIPGTLSLAIKLGHQVRVANEKHNDPINVIKKSIPGSKNIFTGKVIEFSRIEEGGFTSGEIVLESLEKTEDKLRIFYQNEYLLSWLNNCSYITCPDNLLLVDTDTGYGLTPWEKDFEEGRKVTVLGRDAYKIWHSEKGQKIFGPHLFDKDWSEYKVASSFFN